MTSSVSILAPAYNEEAVIRDFAQAVLREMPSGWELLIVDDGSTDATPELLRELSASHDALRVVTHPRNKGLGEALRTGFSEAAGSVIVTIDADMSHPLHLLPVLVTACEEWDAAFGSRFVSGGGMEEVPFVRRMISRVGNVVLRLIFWSSVRDLTTGLRAYRAEVIRNLPLESDSFEIQLEISVRLVSMGARVAEIPLMLQSRAAGESKMRYMALLPRYGRLILRLLKIRWWRGTDAAIDRVPT